MNNNLKKKAASIAVSFVMAGSAGAAIGSPVFADDESDNVTKVEQDASEPVEEETKEEVKEEVKEETTETKEEVKEGTSETKEEVKEEVKEGTSETKEEVKEEVKEETTETKEEVKEETSETKEETETKEEVNKDDNELVQVTRVVKNSKAAASSTSEEHKVSCITTKVDENGKPLKGAVLQILDKDGNVMDEWVSDGTEHETMLPEGEYILHEVTSPDGYKIAPDKTFTVKVEVNDLNAGVDFSEEPCQHYGGTPLYYVESGGEKQEVYCINQDWETPDDNSVYDGKVITPTDITNYTHQTVYIDAHQNKGKIDVSDKTLSSAELYDKILDIVYHRQNAANVFTDLTEAEIRFVTESALKNYTNAGLTRVQRVTVANAPTGYEKTDYYITDDGRYMWYLYPWYRSFVYDPDAPLGSNVYRTDIGNGDAFGNLARHWNDGHGAKNSEESRAKLARYYELYQYLINDRDRHPDDMHLYIFTSNNKSLDLSGNDFDEGAYQNLLGIRWFNPYDEEYQVYLIDVNHSITKPDEPEKPEEPEKPDEPKKPENHEHPQKVVKVERHNEVVVDHSPQTGDEQGDMIPFALAGLALSGAGAGVLVRRRRRI